MFGRSGGHELFMLLHGATCFFAMLLCPLLTADSFLSERKEGTLPLLFLTPLSANDIVAGKFLSHLLRAGSLWLAALPVLLFPLLLGGVEARLALGMFLLESVLVVLSLVIGLAVSASAESTLGVVFTSYLVLGLLALFGGLPLVGALNSLPTVTDFPIAGLVMAGLAVLALLALFFWAAFGSAATQIRQCWRRTDYAAERPPAPDSHVVPAYQPTWYERAVQRRQRRGTPGETPKEQRPTAAFPENSQVLPVVAASRPRWIHRGRPALDWLWARRGLVPGLATVHAVLVGFLSLLTFGNEFRPGPGWGIATLQLLIACFPSAQALRRERQSGALELLLITPLRPKDFLLSHCRWIGQLCGPGAAIYAAFVVGTGVVTGKWHGLPALIWCVACLVALPVIGFWLSLLTRSIVVSLVALIVSTLILPFWTVGIIAFLLDLGDLEWLTPALVPVLVGLLAWPAWRWSLSWLRRRTFPGQRAAANSP
jgi:ABC-type transport system involved in multi-copper enzyme maturation permease subunit